MHDLGKEVEEYPGADDSATTVCRNKKESSSAATGSAGPLGRADGVQRRPHGSRTATTAGTSARVHVRRENHLPVAVLLFVLLPQRLVLGHLDTPPPAGLFEDTALDIRKEFSTRQVTALPRIDGAHPGGPRCDRDYFTGAPRVEACNVTGDGWGGPPSKRLKMRCPITKNDDE